MPELPEVQTIVEGLKAIIGQSLNLIDILNKKTLDELGSEKIQNAIIYDVKRIGKYIIFDFSNLYLIVHLRMTGQFHYFGNSQAFDISKYDRVIFHLSQGVLTFRDVRKFGTMLVTNDYEKELKAIGIDAISEKFTEGYLASELKAARGKIKSFLLKQDKVAGLGNIYVDEALFVSLIHPESICLNIPDVKIKELHSAIVFVLKKGIMAKGTSLGKGAGNYKHVSGSGENQNDLNVYQRSNKPCKLCGSQLQKEKIASRGTTFCLHCQVMY